MTHLSSYNIYVDEGQTLWWRIYCETCRPGVQMYLCMLLDLVLLKLWVGHWLLANITESDVSATVNLMGCKVSLWNVPLAEKLTANKEQKSLINLLMFIQYILWFSRFILTNCHRTVCFHLPWLFQILWTKTELFVTQIRANFVLHSHLNYEVWRMEPHI